MLRRFVILGAIVALLASPVVAATPEGTATPATAIGDSTNSPAPSVQEDNETDADRERTPSQSARVGSNVSESTPAESNTRSGPVEENVTTLQSLDRNASVVDYQLDDGVMTIEVVVTKQTSITATERADRDGAHAVRVESWDYLSPGRHELEVDTFDNQSASVLLYSDRGIEDGRAVEVSVSDGTTLFARPFGWGELGAVGAAAIATIGVAVAWEAIKARLGLGEGGERLA